MSKDIDKSIPNREYYIGAILGHPDNTYSREELSMHTHFQLRVYYAQLVDKRKKLLSHPIADMSGTITGFDVASGKDITVTRVIGEDGTIYEAKLTPEELRGKMLSVPELSKASGIKSGMFSSAIDPKLFKHFPAWDGSVSHYFIGIRPVGFNLPMYVRIRFLDAEKNPALFTVPRLGMPHKNKFPYAQVYLQTSREIAPSCLNINDWNQLLEEIIVESDYDDKFIMYDERNCIVAFPSKVPTTHGGAVMDTEELLLALNRLIGEIEPPVADGPFTPIITGARSMGKSSMLSAHMLDKSISRDWKGFIDTTVLPDISRLKENHASDIITASIAQMLDKENIRSKKGGTK